RGHRAQRVELGPPRRRGGLPGDAEALELRSARPPPHPADPRGGAAEVDYPGGRLEREVDLLAAGRAPLLAVPRQLGRLAEGARGVALEEDADARAQGPVELAPPVEERERDGRIAHEGRRGVSLSTSLAVPSPS